MIVFFKMGQPRPLFVSFRSFQSQSLQKNTVDVSRIQTRIVGVEGKHADHLTTTTAPVSHDCSLPNMDASVWPIVTFAQDFVRKEFVGEGSIFYFNFDEHGGDPYRLAD